MDSVYQHVLGWREALEAAGIELAVWRIHRRVGMSGGLLANALLREMGRQVTVEEAARLQDWHAEACARDLLAYLSQVGVLWAIATSGRLESARPALEILRIGPEVPVVTRDQVPHAKPEPDLFLAAAERLKVPIDCTVVVGDSVLGSPRRPSRSGAGRGAPLRRLRRGGTRARRCLPRVSRPGRLAPSLG